MGNTLNSRNDKLSKENTSLPPAYENLKNNNIVSTFNNKYPMDIFLRRLSESTVYLKYIVDSPAKFEMVIEKCKTIKSVPAHPPLILVRPNETVILMRVSPKSDCFIEFYPNDNIADFLIKYSKYTFKNSSDIKNSWVLDLHIYWRGCRSYQPDTCDHLEEQNYGKTVNDNLIIDFYSLKNFMEYIKDHQVFKTKGVRFYVTSPNHKIRLQNAIPTEILFGLELELNSSTKIEKN